MISIEKILKEYWGFTNFRTPQKEIITNVLEKKDVVALLPTGGGKSLCFQIPALAKEGVCIVISPLIALMQDQVNNLKKRHIKATTIASGSSENEIITIFDSIKFGNYKFLYISPERLQTTLIQQKIKELNICLIAIDEAHCISEWGNDFRPSYRNISILKTLTTANFIALTATANKKVIEDITKNLGLQNPEIFKKSFYRENLAYQIFKTEDKLQRLLLIFKKTKKPAIIYVNARKKTTEIASFLNANGFKSTFYHGGLTAAEKEDSFTNWMQEKTPIIVATNAFGMGIDKTNVGLVIHFNLPTSIENYIQETGRAGRNNEKSFGVLLYNEHDLLLFKEQTANSLPSLKEIKEVHKKLYQHCSIANGEILETSFDFNFLEFCKKYRLSIFKTDTILKLLANYGIIELSHNFYKKSTLQFIANHKSVLSYSNQNKKFDNFLTILLRTYGGLFENETKINEFFIAKKTGITSHQVVKNLHTLQTQNLVKYQPITTDISIRFLVPREDDKTINRHSKEMQQFLKLKKQKAVDFINFITNNDICRSIQLLSYFEEKDSIQCEICDVCILHKKAPTHTISRQITTLLKAEKKLTSQEISLHLNILEKDILIHLRQLLAENQLTITHQNQFELKK